MLVDGKVLSNSPITCGNKPKDQPANSPALPSLKPTLWPEGLSSLHAATLQQGPCRLDYLYLANTRELLFQCKTSPFPSLGPGCFDRSLFGPLGFDRQSTFSAQKVDAPTRSDRKLEDDSFALAIDSAAEEQGCLLSLKRSLYQMIA